MLPSTLLALWLPVGALGEEGGKQTPVGHMVRATEEISKKGIGEVKNENKNNCFLFTDLNKQNSLPRSVCLREAALLLCRS